MTGQYLEDGMLTAFYEFRHLTFQEFLTARAVVDGWHSGRSSTDTLVSVLWPHIEEEKWREVILLSSALGRKDSDHLIRQLNSSLADKPKLISLLAQCLADDAPAQPETIRQAMKSVILEGHNYGSNTLYPTFGRGRYGRMFREEAGLAYEAGTPNLDISAEALTYAIIGQVIGAIANGDWLALREQCVDRLHDQNRIKRCEGALLLVEVLKTLRKNKNQHVAEDSGNIPNKRSDDPDTQSTDFLRDGFGGLVNMLFADHPSENHAACMALELIGNSPVPTPKTTVDVFWRLMTLGAESSNPELSSRAKNALFAQLQVMRSTNIARSLIHQHQFDELVKNYDQLTDSDTKFATLLLAWHRNDVWDDSHLADRLIILVNTNLHPAARLGAIYLLVTLANRLIIRHDVPRDFKRLVLYIRA